MRTLTLFYAMGGGLGHLQRCAALLQPLGLLPQEVVLCSASPYLSDFAQSQGLRYYTIPHSWSGDLSAVQLFLTRLLQKERIGTVYLDVFPAGILGEWNALLPQFATLTYRYIARRMKWERYVPLLRHAPAFQTTLVVEDLQADHLAFVQAHSQHIIQQTISYPIPYPIPDLPTVSPVCQPYYLILHSEPADEIATLLHYAYDMRQLRQEAATLVVISQVAPSAIANDLNSYMADCPIMYLNTFDTAAWVAHAQAVFTGCGFNSMTYLRPYRHKHYCIPFARQYDDQFWRRTHYYSR